MRAPGPVGPVRITNKQTCMRCGAQRKLSQSVVREIHVCGEKLMKRREVEEEGERRKGGRKEEEAPLQAPETLRHSSMRNFEKYP